MGLYIQTDAIMKLLLKTIAYASCIAINLSLCQCSNEKAEDIVLPEIPEEEDDMDTSINNMQAPKDVTPVINMFKNMAISLESLGYKLNIYENNSEQSYTINIEVEK